MKNESVQNEKFPRERSPDTEEELPFSDDERRKEDTGADWGKPGDFRGTSRLTVVVRVDLCGEETKDKLQDGDLWNQRELFPLQSESTSRRKYEQGKWK